MRKAQFKLFLFTCLIVTNCNILLAQLTPQWYEDINTNSTSQSTTYLTALDVDNAKNSYVAGTFNGTVDFDPSSSNSVNLTSITSNDIFFAKYDSLGNLVWAKSIFAGHNAGAVNINGIKVDGGGNFYLFGTVGDTVDWDPGNGTAWSYEIPDTGAYYGISFNNFVAKYDLGGNVIFGKRLGNANISTLNLDGLGNIYLSGRYGTNWNSQGYFNPANYMFGKLTGYADFDVFLAKYDNSFNFLYAKSIDVINGSNELDHSLEVDAAGNQYLFTYGGGGIWDFDPSTTQSYTLTLVGGNITIAKYDPYGNFIWARIVGDIGSGTGVYAKTASIKVDGNGNIFCHAEMCYHVQLYNAGNLVDYTSLFQTGYGYHFIAKFTPSGDLINYVQCNRSSNINTLEIAQTGDIYGFLYDGYTGQNFYICKYDNALNPFYTASFTNYYKTSGTIKNGSIFVAGTFYVNTTPSDVDPTPATVTLSAPNNFGQNAFLIRYNELNTMQIDDFNDNSAAIKIYPIPTCNNITVQSLNELGLITIYNSLGETIFKTKSKNNLEQIDISKFSSGIYSLQIQNKNIKIIKE